MPEPGGMHSASPMQIVHPMHQHVHRHPIITSTPPDTPPPQPRRPRPPTRPQGGIGMLKTSHACRLLAYVHVCTFDVAFSISLRLYIYNMCSPAHQQVCTPPHPPTPTPPTPPPPQVGIVTLKTPREVAAEAGVSLSEVPISDERVGAVVVTGAQIRCAPT